ncbi:hypothetical protein OS493_029233 [Desmophyllum pertusum]|uniref:Uncharacterized protein n=1 Tax=Desmophyllum pertusum TaxID=174260 RepID=A0A9W9ZK91_9CNID|nr:hypothetical protein OS493_029233 [Desmophyllum pertusum]
MATPSSRPRRHTETQTPYTRRTNEHFCSIILLPLWRLLHPTHAYYHNSSSRKHIPRGGNRVPVIPTGVVTSVPVVHPGVVTETPTVHHIHHLPRGKSRSRRDHGVSDSEDSESDEEYPAQRSWRAIDSISHWTWPTKPPKECSTSPREC